MSANFIVGLLVNPMDLGIKYTEIGLLHWKPDLNYDLWCFTVKGSSVYGVYKRICKKAGNMRLPAVVGYGEEIRDIITGGELDRRHNRVRFFREPPRTNLYLTDTHFYVYRLVCPECGAAEINYKEAHWGSQYFTPVGHPPKGLMLDRDQIQLTCQYCQKHWQGPVQHIDRSKFTLDGEIVSEEPEDDTLFLRKTSKSAELSRYALEKCLLENSEQIRMSCYKKGVHYLEIYGSEVPGWAKGYKVEKAAHFRND